MYIYIYIYILGGTRKRSGQLFVRVFSGTAFSNLWASSRSCCFHTSRDLKRQRLDSRPTCSPVKET